MANTNTKTKTPRDKRNLKYGSLSVTVTVIFVALMIILNIILSSIGFYTDMTSSGFYTLSDSFIEQMDSYLNPEGASPVYLNIVLMCEEDVFAGYGSFAPIIYRSLIELVREFDNINLVAYNTTIHPELAEKYKTTALDTPALDDVVFELCDKNGTPLVSTPAKKFTSASFFVSDSESGEVVGYKAEERLLSAVALLTGKAEKPTAYYLQGHGEPTLEEAPEWREVLELAGFNVQPINLASEEFTEEKSDDNILVINSPKYDLTSAADFSEVKKIRTFLGTNYGNMIVVEDASIPTLPALEGLLSEFGLGFGSSVTDDKHSISGSGAGKLFADYTKTYTVSTDGSKGSLSSQILGKIFGKTTSNLPNAVFTTPKEVTIADNGEIASGMNASAQSFALLQTYDTAITKGKDGINVQGSVATLGVARVIWEVNNDETSYMVAIGSSDFLSTEYEKSCANRDIVFELLNLMWDSSISFNDIQYKKFDDTSLTDVSTAAANTWTILCVGVIPVIIAGLGVFVYVRRRHS